MPIKTVREHNARNYKKFPKMNSFFEFVSISYTVHNIDKKFVKKYKVATTNERLKMLDKKDIRSNFFNVMGGIKNWSEKLKKIQILANSQEYIDAIKKNDHNKIENLINDNQLQITGKDRVNLYWYNTYQSFKQGRPAHSLLYLQEFTKNSSKGRPPVYETDKDANNLFNRLLMGKDLFNKVEMKGYRIPNKGMSRNIRAVTDFIRSFALAAYRGVTLKSDKPVTGEVYGRQSSHFSNSKNKKTKVKMHYGYDYNEDDIKNLDGKCTTYVAGQVGSGGPVYIKPESHGANYKNFKEYTSHGLSYFSGDSKKKKYTIKSREGDIPLDLVDPYIKFFSTIAKDATGLDLNNKKHIAKLPKKPKGVMGKLFAKIKKRLKTRRSRVFRLCQEAGIWRSSKGELIVPKKTNRKKIDKFINYVTRKYPSSANTVYIDFLKGYSNYVAKHQSKFTPIGNEIIIRPSDRLYQGDKMYFDKLQKNIFNAPISKLIGVTKRSNKVEGSAISKIDSNKATKQLIQQLKENTIKTISFKQLNKMYESIKENPKSKSVKQQPKNTLHQFQNKKKTTTIQDKKMTKKLLDEMKGKRKNLKKVKPTDKK